MSHPGLPPAIQCSSTVGHAAACRDQTARSCPCNVCNVYNSSSYPQFVSTRLHSHTLMLIHNNGCLNRDGAVSNTILGSVCCSSDKYRFTYCLLVCFSLLLWLLVSLVKGSYSSSWKMGEGPFLNSPSYRSFWLSHLHFHRWCHNIKVFSNQPKI